MKEVSLALGGGGARGLAHLKVLEFFDREGIRVSKISGSSIGAVVGALYASGLSALEIQEKLHQYLILKNDRKRNIFKKLPNVLSWFSMLNMDLREPGIIKADSFLKKFMSDLESKRFEELKVPLTIITTNYWTGEEVAFDSGPLMPALLASSAIPGMFPAVEHQGMVLVDGSLSNYVPFSHWLEDESVTVAVDVASDRTQVDPHLPKIREAAEGMFDIVFDRMIQKQMETATPDIYFRPGIKGVSILDFDKIDSIYQQTEHALPELRRLCREKGLEL